jgi:hypothetical protein
LSLYASAAEELTPSIAAINRQIVQSGRIADKVVETAGHTTIRSGLADAAQRLATQVPPRVCQPRPAA